MSKNGKWALITGATAGIGESFSRLLAEKGFNLILVARDLPRLNERAQALEASYKVETKVIQADLATNEGCQSIEDFINQDQLIDLMKKNGFEKCKYRNLSGGIVSIHSGWKI